MRDLMSRHSDPVEYGESGAKGRSMRNMSITWPYLTCLATEIDGFVRSEVVL